MNNADGPIQDAACPRAGVELRAERIEQKIDLLLEAVAALKTLTAPLKERQPVAEGGITVAEAARRLACSASKAYRLYGTGELTGHSVGEKIVIDPASVEAYKQRHTNKNNVREMPAEPPPQARRRFRHLDL